MKTNILQVRINADGPTGLGTKITTLEGVEINGVKRAVVTIDPSKANTAMLEVHSRFEGVANAEFHVMDPVSGKVKQVKTIEFADGSFFGE